MNVLVISPYPPANITHAKLRGAASYTKNLCERMYNCTGEIRILVLANILNDSRAGSAPAKRQNSPNTGLLDPDDRNKPLVIRCWRERLTYPIRIFMQVLKHRKRIGKGASAGIFPLLLVLMRIARIPTVITMHGVVGKKDVTQRFLGQHFIKLHRRLIKIGFHILNGFIERFADKVVVHEKAIKDILVSDYGIDGGMIDIIPHGIEPKKNRMEKSSSRAAVGLAKERMLLFFGYLAGYKGLDVLIESFKYLDADIYALYLSGEMPHNFRDNSSYLEYLDNLKRRAASISKNIVFTGFIPEDKISMYFSSCDLIIFPYPEMHASSGPFSLAVSYGCPFLGSKAFAEYYSIPPELSFDCDAVSLSRRIDQFFRNDTMKITAVRWLNDYREKHLWHNIAKRTLELYRQLGQCNT
jgi:glycosyltransferase involved in cell wall biosynthesis